MSYAVLTGKTPCTAVRCYSPMYSIVDSHVHLIASGRPLWKWQEPHPLSGDFRLAEYCNEDENTERDRFSVEGLVWIEADSPYTLDLGLDGVRTPIAECAFVVEESRSRPGYIKAMIPWAPIAWGTRLGEYVDALQTAVGDDFARVKGFRFLLQDKPRGTMLAAEFVEGLQWVDARDYVFEWGIDMHNGGLWQFEESLQVFRQVPRLKYIINHLTKPNLALDPQTVRASGDFLEWKRCMEEMYRATPNSYMKLLGGLSELPEHLLRDADAAAAAIWPWFEVCFALWGPSRTIWASNWPVCRLQSGPHLNDQWFEITEKLFDQAEVSVEDRTRVYSTNYLRAYNIE